MAEISTQVREGTLSPVDLVEALFEGIDDLEPSLGAWITLDREGAFEAARALEKDLAGGADGGSLCGVPVGIKDIFYTAGLKTTASSPLWADFVPDHDANCVARLREQGAIVLGKTMTTQFASGDPTPTRSPWGGDVNPGGSSTGSAVAVAARMCPAALGSQTGGSTLRPASYHGIVGLKPTYGRITKHGVIPLVYSFDTVGILVRTVQDAAMMLQAMAGHDPSDRSSSNAPVDDYVGALRTLPRAPRLGLVREYFLEECDEETRGHVEHTAELLASKGAEIDEVALPPSLQLISEISRAIGGPETAAFQEKAMRESPESFAPGIRASIEAGALVPAVTYVQGHRLRGRYQREMEAIAAQYDALLTPSTPTPPQRDLSNTGDPRFQSPWTLAGLPAMSLPSGLGQDGAPMGIQLISKSLAEGLLLGVAAWCEEAMGVSLVPPVSVGGAASPRTS